MEKKQNAGQEFEMNNNCYSSTHLPHPPRVIMCHRSTQWAESDCRVAVANYKSATTKEPPPPQLLMTKRGSNAEEGLTALKIKQLSNSQQRSSDKRIIPQVISLVGYGGGGAGKAAQNGHVNDLKMRFEDGGGDVREQKNFQKAVDSVTMINRLVGNKLAVDEEVQNGKTKENNNANSTRHPEVKQHEIQTSRDKDKLEDQQLNRIISTLSPDQDDQDDDEEEEENETEFVVLRRTKRTADKEGSRLSERLSNGLQKYKLLNEFGGSVHSLEDILNQQRFSRSLSQYSVSDLFRNESPAQISRDCERFDELFCRSTGDLRVVAARNGRNDDEYDDDCPMSKFGSMVDVVNV